MEDDNINGKEALLRDTFLEAEKEYLEELIKRPMYKDFIENLSLNSAKGLYLEAIKRINDIETCRVKEEDLVRVETEITLLLASIQDCVRKRVKERLQKREDDFIR